MEAIGVTHGDFICKRAEDANCGISNYNTSRISNRDAFDTAYTAIVLTTLIAVAWGISTRETTFKHLGLNSSGY